MNKMFRQGLLTGVVTSVAAVLWVLIIPLPILLLWGMDTTKSIGEELIPCLYSPHIENYFSFFKMGGTDYLTQHNPFISYMYGLSWLFSAMNRITAVVWTYYLMAVQYYLFLFLGTYLFINHSGCDKKISWFASAFACIIFYSHNFYVDNWTPLLFLTAANLLYFSNIRHKRWKLFYLFLLNISILSLFCSPYQHAPMFFLLALVAYLIYPIRFWPFATYMIMVLVTWLLITFPALLALAVSSEDSSRWLYFGYPESSALYNLVRGIYFQKINYIFLVLFFTSRWLNTINHVPRIFIWRHALLFLILINAYKILESFSWLLFGKSQNFQYFDISKYALLILFCHLMGLSISYLKEVDLWKIKHNVYLFLTILVILSGWGLRVWGDYYVMSKTGDANISSLYNHPTLNRISESHSSKIHVSCFPYNRTVFLGMGDKGMRFPNSLLQFYGLDILFGYSANMNKDKDILHKVFTANIKNSTPYTVPLVSYYNKYLPLDFGSGDFDFDRYYDIRLFKIFHVRYIVSLRPLVSDHLKLVCSPDPYQPPNVVKLYAYELIYPQEGVMELSLQDVQSLNGKTTKEKVAKLLDIYQNGIRTCLSAKLTVHGSKLRIEAQEANKYLLVPYDLRWRRFDTDNQKMMVVEDIGRIITVVKVNEPGMTHYFPTDPYLYSIRQLIALIKL